MTTTEDEIPRCNNNNVEASMSSKVPSTLTQTIRFTSPHRAMKNIQNCVVADLFENMECKLINAMRHSAIASSCSMKTSKNQAESLCSAIASLTHTVFFIAVRLDKVFTLSSMSKIQGNTYT